MSSSVCSYLPSAASGLAGVQRLQGHEQNPEKPITLSWILGVLTSLSLGEQK